MVVRFAIFYLFWERKHMTAIVIPESQSSKPESVSRTFTRLRINRADSRSGPSETLYFANQELAEDHIKVNRLNYLPVESRALDQVEGWIKNEICYIRSPSGPIQIEVFGV
jgi:hypothetical protein